MKRIFVLVFSFILALSLVSCPTNGGSSVNPDNGSEEPTTPEQPTTPDEPTTPTTPEEPETPVIPQKEMCEICGVAHYKTDKYHFDTPDDIFDWTDEKVKEYYNPLGLEEDVRKPNSHTEYNIFFYYGTPNILQDETKPIGYFTNEPYKNEDKLVIPRMYKNIPVRGFTSTLVNHLLWDDKYFNPPLQEKRKDIRNIYMHKNVIYGSYTGADWDGIDNMNLYYEGTVEDFKQPEVLNGIASIAGISGTLYTLLDGKTSKWSYHRVEEL